MDNVPPGARSSPAVVATVSPCFYGFRKRCSGRPTNRARPSSLRRSESVRTIRYRRVPVLVAVAEPGLLRRVRRESDDHAGEEGAAKEGTSAAHSRNNVLCRSAPVCKAFPEHAGEVCEDVDDHQHAPGDEAQRVQSAQLAAAVPDDEQRNAGSEQRQRGGDEQRSQHPQQQPRRSFEPVELVAGVVARESPAGTGELEQDRRDEQEPEEDVHGQVRP